MEKFGIENLKKVIALPFEGGNVTDLMLNTSGAAKWMHLMKLADELMGYATVDWSLLDDEYKDLSTEEKTEINEFIKTKFDIADDKVERAVEMSFAILLRMEGIIKETIALVKDFKGTATA